MFKAFKNKDGQFFKSMAGAFVPANNKENFSSSLKAVYFGYTNKNIKIKSTSVSGVLQNAQFISLYVMTFHCRHFNSEYVSKHSA